MGLSDIDISPKGQQEAIDEMAGTKALKETIVRLSTKLASIKNVVCVDKDLNQKAPTKQDYINACLKVIQIIES